jgi:integrating conjugative element relaxase (TIGR03760 family)
VTHNWYLYAAASLGTMGVGLLLSVRNRHPHTLAISKSAPVPITQAGRLAVLRGDALIAHLGLEELVDGCRTRIQVDQSLFNKDYLPVIHNAAEWVQLLPASESHHHAHPGGLMLHMLESVLHATRFREGMMLPVGASVEEIPARKHRWTYGVFLAALLHDIGRPVADINVHIFRVGKVPDKWHPLAGSMLEQGVNQYALNFEIKSKSYDLHKKLPIVLFQRIVPSNVLAWLAEDTQLMNELTSYLSGDEHYQGALREIVTKADSESVKTNLMHGPRTRFAAAKSVPLIERLMQALRMMLAEQGRISLNRPGAQGFVFDGSVWFVSKRLADDVRAFLRERESSEGIPGPDKNDRLFDTWQEYGALTPTPEHRAVWLVMVQLDDGWEQKLTLLRFPLEKLYQATEHYPPTISGKIILIQRGEADPEDVFETTETAEPDHIEQQEDNVEPEIDAGQNTTLHQQSGDNNPFPEPEESLAPIPIYSGAIQPDKKKPASMALPTIKAPPKPILHEQDGDAEEFLNEDDTATKPKPTKNIPPDPVALRPVAPAGQSMPKLGATLGAKQPSAAAHRFIRWVQDGLSSGDLKYNRADAMIHFVPEGMMLVSPTIFRRFAELFGEEGTGKPSERTGDQLGTGIQRQVTNSGWNVQTGEKKSNIQRYVVVGLEGKGKHLISGVVIMDPVRFVNPLPPINPCVVLFEKPIEGKVE